MVQGLATLPGSCAQVFFPPPRVPAFALGFGDLGVGVCGGALWEDGCGVGTSGLHDVLPAGTLTPLSLAALGQGFSFGGSPRPQASMRALAILTLGKILCLKPTILFCRTQLLRARGERGRERARPAGWQGTAEHQWPVASVRPGEQSGPARPSFRCLVILWSGAEEPSVST